MKTILICLTLLLANITTGKAQWTQCDGPLGGAIRFFGVSGTNLFATSSDGGFYRSINQGETWAASSTGLKSTFVSSLTTVGSNIFVATIGAGVYISSDAGTNWKKTDAM